MNNKLKKKLLKFVSAEVIEEIDAFTVNNYYNSGRCISSCGKLGWRPQADVFECGDELVIIIDVSGVDHENVEIKVNEETLIFRGERLETEEKRKRHYYKMEIDFGPFERLINLPIKVDSKNYKTCYNNGFYTIKIKKI